jgi:hypothetical protein
MQVGRAFLFEHGSCLSNRGEAAAAVAKLWQAGRSVAEKNPVYQIQELSFKLNRVIWNFEVSVVSTFGCKLQSSGFRGNYRTSKSRAVRV